MKRKLTFITTALLCLTALQALAATDNIKDPHPKTLRAMSYNTWYVFNQKKEMAAGKEWVNEQTPDIVALQELTSIKPELLQSFAESWGHKHSSLLKSSGFSVGLTSRYPIETIEKGRKDMHHGFLHARTGGIEIFVVHLSPFKHTVRQREANILLTRIKPLLEAKKKVIVLGDFNALSPVDSSLLDKDKKALEGALASDAKHGHVQNLKDGKFEYGVMQTFFDGGLIDTAKGKLPLTLKDRISCPTGVFGNKPTPPKSGQRIDYILTGPQLHKLVTQMSIPRKDELNRISDHYPVIVDFEK